MNFYVDKKSSNYLMSLVWDAAYKKLDGRKQYRGLILRDPEFSEFLSNEVNKKFYDAEGTLSLQNLFEDLSETGFDSESLKSFFSSEEIPTDWKIGEKISECFLEANCDSVFPYNDSRDAKDSKSNLPGTDMVGYVRIDEKPLFLFGEVKTSDDSASPPSVVYGKDGLIHQLNEIKDDPKKRKELIQWLGHKISNLADDDSHQIAWKDAVVSYTCNEEYKIFGVMLRGVEPDERDLKNVFDAVILNMKNQTYLELLSLYLPISKHQYAIVMGGSN